jgi:hypothetical protein
MGGGVNKTVDKPVLTHNPLAKFYTGCHRGDLALHADVRCVRSYAVSPMKTVDLSNTGRISVSE